MSSRLSTALKRLQQPSVILVSLLSGVFLLVAGVLTSLAVKSGQIASELQAGSYVLSRPLVISSSPLLRVDAGTVKFLAKDTMEQPSLEKDSGAYIKARLLGILPSQWTEFFTEQKLTDLTLEDAVVTLDLRGKPDELVDPQRAIGLALKNSYLEHANLLNTTLIVLRDFSKPQNIIIKNGLFNIDLPDREFSGSGLLNIDGMDTGFTLNNDFSKSDDEGSVVNQIKLELKGDVFSGYFEGSMAGRHGLFLKGKTNFKTTDAALISDWLGIEDREPLEDGLRVQPETGNLDFSVSGLLDWSLNEGTLSDCSFGFNGNMASGSLSLRFSQANPELSGTLAFPMLDLTPQAHLLGIGDVTLKGDADKVLDGSQEGNDQLSITASYLYKLIRNFDADIRMSAQTVKIGGIELEETGFSLFQKKGEFIVDMAGVSLFDGHATGLIKIDTNFPKPRWHMNVSFNNIEVSLLGSVIGYPEFLKGAGDMKVHITSYGDKVTELYQNMFGTLKYTMNKGGVIGLDVAKFKGEQSLNSEEELALLLKGSAQFNHFSSKGHFSKGSVYLDHFILHADANEYTGQGNWHIPSEKLDVHIASWPYITGTALNDHDLKNAQDSPDAKSSELSGDENSGSKSTDAPKTALNSNDVNSPDVSASGDEDGQPKDRIPELLACSHIYGPIGQYRLEKFTGVHLNLLKKECAAPYRLQPLKTKRPPIVRSDNAG